MSVFGKILEKLGLRKDKDDDKPATVGTKDVAKPKPSTTTTTTASKPTGTAPTSQTGVRPAGGVTGQGQQPGTAVKDAPAATPAIKPIAEADVMRLLEDKAKGTGLNWKQSIADLLALLDIDNSYQARVELAKELNAPEEVMGDSAKMNTWLHKEVLRKIAQNGGNIPKELLD
jgi:hypothetical protein